MILNNIKNQIRKHFIKDNSFLTDMYYVSCSQSKGNKPQQQDSTIIILNGEVISLDNEISESLTINKDGYLIVAVADGVSSSFNPKMASLCAVKKIADLNHMISNYNTTEIMNLMDAVNEAVIEINTTETSATTLNVFCLDSRGNYISFNIGDSLTYAVKHSKSVLLSETHSLAAMKRKRKLPVYSEGEEHVLMRYLGHTSSSGAQQVYISTGTLESNQSILVCTDGLMEKKEIKKKIIKCFKENTTIYPAKQLVDYYQDQSEDNISCICIKRKRIESKSDISQ